MKDKVIDLLFWLIIVLWFVVPMVLVAIKILLHVLDYYIGMFSNYSIMNDLERRMP